MKRGFFLFAMFFLFRLSVYASELQVFKDKAVYFPDKPKSFIGFNNAEVYCNGERVKVYRIYKAKGNSPLEKKYNQFLGLKEEESYLKKKLSVFDSVVKSANLKTAGDIYSFLKNLPVYTKNYVKDEAKLNEIAFKLQSLKSYLSSVTHDFNPYYVDLPPGCKDMKIVFEGIDFDTENLFIVGKDGAQAVKRLKIINRSGIDIFAEKILLMNFSSKRYFVPRDFNPWSVDFEREEIVMRMVMPQAPSKKSFKMKNPKPEARQIESRVYLLKNLDLPCDGKEKKITIAEKSIAFEHSLVVFPYVDLTVYNEYAFKLPFEPDSNEWIVKVGKKVFSKCYGKLDSKRKKYKIFAGEDFSISVSRKRIVSFEKNVGFFKGKNVKKDGYEIELYNLSEKNKKLKVIDRIPVPKKEEIKVKNVKISGAPYVLDKEGKVVFNVSLKPGEFKKLRVVFEIEYPEDQSIYY